MKMIATASGEIGPAQRALMQAAQKVILGIEADIDALPTVRPAELAAGFPDGELRQQFTNGMIVVAVADGVPSRETLARVDAFAKALGIAEPVLADLRLLAENHMTLFKLDFLRRGHIGDMMKNELAQKGPFQFAKSILRLRGMTEDRDLAARYRAWEKLPEGTLGRSLIDFYNQHGFSVPGERNGFPEAGLYHDFSHLLGGYSTEPEGEVQVAAFTAGYKRERPFYVMLFVVLIFSAGVNMRPTPDDFVTAGVLGKPGIAELMLAAVERGSKVNQDLSDKWDYWRLIELPIDEVRQRLNILPKA
jgi:ubiquinone biosynthesis protein Coq4